MNKLTKNESKKTLVTFISVLAVILVIIAGINYYFDWFGVFHINLKTQDITPNERFVKIQHVLKNKDKYDSFIFGSSRGNLVDPTLFKNGKYYNLSAEVLSPYEVERTIKFLLKNDIKIKNIVYVAESNTLRFHKRFMAQSSTSDIIHLYYPVNIFEKTIFYSAYLFYCPIIDKSKRDKWKLGEYIETYGTNASRLRKEEAENASTQKDLKPKRDFLYSYDERTIFVLKEIDDLCKKNNINYTLLFAPEYSKNYLLNSPNGFIKKKKRLARYTSFYDFSGINEITTNTANFSFSEHFTIKVGDMIAKRIQEPKDKPNEIKNFGVYVTSANIKEHTQNICKATPDLEQCIKKKKKRIKRATKLETIKQEPKKPTVEIRKPPKENPTEFLFK